MNRFNGNRGGVLKVLLIIFGVLFVCVIAIGIYVAMHWKGWAADVANAAAQEIVSDSGLPEDQKQSILADIRQLGDDFKTGKISMEQLGHVAKAITDSESSNMTAEEKAAAILTMQRYARGVHERKISTDQLERDSAPIAVKKNEHNWQLKENPTPMEINEFLANAKRRADEANIPNEAFDLNIAEELRKAIRVD
jgi:hypothetical protein